ncbi:MAG: FAD binding domain-containing protein, partial [Pseudomonadota bacterium]
LGELIRRIGGPQVRGSGTICGNIANGSPIGDMPPALIALGADLHLRKGDATRILALEDFFIEYGRQDLSPGEFVEAVSFAAPATHSDFACYKISKRFESDISAVMAAINVVATDSRITSVRIAFGGMAGTPKRALATETALLGAPVAQASFAAAAEKLRDDFAPLSDLRGTSEYRLLTAKRLLQRYAIERLSPDVPTRLVGCEAVLA